MKDETATRRIFTEFMTAVKEYEKAVMKMATKQNIG